MLKCIRMLTFLPLEEIDKMDSWEGAQLNTAKEILAYELTKLVHGEEEAEKAQAAAKALFSQGAASRHADNRTDTRGSDRRKHRYPEYSCRKSGLVPSRAEARRAVQQGGVTVEGEKVGDIKTSYTADTLGEGLVVKKGKKNFRKVVMK